MFKLTCFPPKKTINRRNESTRNQQFRMFVTEQLLYIFNLILSILCICFFPRQATNKKNYFSFESCSNTCFLLKCVHSKTGGNWRQSREEHPKNNVSRDTNVSRVKEKYVTQASEEIEGRVTKICPHNLVGQIAKF